jgi:hypothetical protein
MGSLLHEGAGLNSDPDTINRDRELIILDIHAVEA